MRHVSAAMARRWLGAGLLWSAIVPLGPACAEAPTVVETPSLAEKVTAGELPPVAERVPSEPAVAQVRSPGQPGGSLRMLMSGVKDTRQMMVYGYARLVGYDEKLQLVPDLLASVDVEEGRVFTLHLRPGHRWSDGKPFTAEDFRYYWEDVANNAKLSPMGPPKTLMVDGEKAEFSVIDETTVRYSWSRPNPALLTEMAGASPLLVYTPAHYLKQFHEKFNDPKELEQKAKAAGQRNWAALHNRMDNTARMDNPALPTLQPWMIVTQPPSERFVFARNPYYHRVDFAGHQLPYIDEVTMAMADAKLIPAKTGAGESDLQARYLRFDNVTFLKQAAHRNDFKVDLWRTGKGSHVALFPNLNCDDPVWRAVFRDVRFRRALSLAIDRHEVNQVIYYGLALEGGNTVLPESPLFRTAYRDAWTRFDVRRANALLDDMGLKRGSDGIRRLSDGREAMIVVETAGESTEQTDVLELVRDTWLQIGIKLFPKPLQREVFRNRIFAGQTLMSVWTGLENGLATADMSPQELAPTDQQQLQWPKWGQFYETRGQAGEKPALPETEALLATYQQWKDATDTGGREAAWRTMLAAYADQVWSIGIIGGVLQPIVVSNRLHNVPEKGFFNWDPGAHFGIFRPDTFWLSPPPTN